MKKFLFLFIIVLFIFPTLSSAQTDKLYLLASDTDYGKATQFVAFLRSNGVTVIRFTMEHFDRYKTERFMSVMASLESPEIFEVIKPLLKEEESKEIPDSEVGSVLIKEDAWASPQGVLIFVGRDAAAVEQARKINRDIWMDTVAEWFDLEISWMMKEY